MGKSSWNYYGVKLIYQMVVTGEPIAERLDESYNDNHIFFEESVVLTRAQSFEHAYKLAERKARERNEIYTNSYGQAVECKFIGAIDCYIIYDNLSGGTELYSTITPVGKELTPNEYLMRKYDYSLDNYGWNEQNSARKRELMTVLLYEEFSKWRKQ